MHGVAGLRAAEVGEAGPGDKAVGGVHMIERRQDTTGREEVVEGKCLCGDTLEDEGRERAALAGSVEGQGVRGGRFAEDGEFGASLDNVADAAGAGGIEELDEVHGVGFFVARFCQFSAKRLKCTFLEG